MGKPIFEAIRTAITNTSNTLKNIWDTVIKPVWDNFIKAIDEIWTNHLKPLVANFLDFVGTLANGALDIYNKFILPVVNWLVDTFGPTFTNVFNGIVNTIGPIIGNIIDAINGIITALKGVVEFIVSVFTGDWKKAWEGIKLIFKGIWDAFVGIAGTPLNLIIDGINALLRGIASGVSSMVNLVISGVNALVAGVLTPINLIIDALNLIPGMSIPKLSLTIPSVPDWGQSVFQIPKIPIPKLAQGAVIPPNQPFAAILGDQRQGTNVEAPLGTIQDAVSTAMYSELGVIMEDLLDEIRALRAEARNAGTNIELDGTILGRLLRPYLSAENNRVGFAMGGAR